MSTIDDTRWDLVRRREPAADFLYAVTTMGIYCRPGCPAPRPKRENVRFFADAPAAEAAGFRACRRCDPRGERAALARDVVRDACAFMEAEDAIPSLDRLAARSGYSRFHFLRMFKEHTGLTPRSYAEGVRARRLQAALQAGARVADAVAEAGFGSESRVYEDTGRLLGMTPGALRRGGAGRDHPHRLRRLPVRPPAGRRDRDGRVLPRLRRTRRRADGRSAPPFPARQRGRRRCRARRHRAGGAGLPRRTEGGARPAARPARHRVPAAGVGGAAANPAGRDAQLCATRRHGRRAGAVRAVARSCAVNPVSLAVPCHRAVGADGSLTGYRWGIPRKQALLARERGTITAK